jgi:hypothetical protein
MSGTSEKTVKIVKYIMKYGTLNEIELVRSGGVPAKTVYSVVKTRVSPPRPKKGAAAPKLDTTVIGAHVPTSSITTTIVDPEKVAYVKKHGNDVQRMVVEKNPSALDKIYTTIIKQDQASLPPTPMPVEVPPTFVAATNWEAKYNGLWDKYEKLLSICTNLEVEVMELKGESVQKDYTQLKGEDITIEELDEAGIAFTDYPTHVRLIKEHQEHLYQEQMKGFNS